MTGVQWAGMLSVRPVTRGSLRATGTSGYEGPQAIAMCQIALIGGYRLNKLEVVSPYHFHLSMIRTRRATTRFVRAVLARHEPDMYMVIV